MKKMTEIHYLLPIDCIYLSDEIDKIKNLMNIDFDDDFLLSKYDSYGRGRGDIVVFKNEVENPEFMLFDLYNSFTDQHNMVLFGVCCFEPRDIEKLMLELYNKSEPTSKFIFGEENYLCGVADYVNYPKLIKYGDQVYSQRVELYVNNRLVMEPK
ncbi:hypothetical protein [Paenibacillus sp. FSL H7-0331]|uniref:hypothetical protein n=1 Tax=Paenibacillus sp. FSL H7-0331 TaxID=1920421 RepID=UPI00096C85D7|nr:hypothetical protein [Paenibacillus sp. FSL H7-0331]OME90452.1 hypothetical protein BK127_42230 [Paenibacillus sp. FSL H7-0331]